MRTRPVQYCTVPGCVEEAISALAALEPHWIPDRLCITHLTMVRRYIAQLARLTLAPAAVHPSEERLGFIDHLRGFVSQT